jgi:hypothetical protein
MQFSSVTCYFFSLMSKHLLQCSVLRSLRVNDQHSHSYKTIRKVTCVWILIFVLLNRREKNRGIWTEMVIQRICPGPRLGEHFRNKLIFYGEELLAPRPTPKLEDHPLSAVCDCFAATLHTWWARPSNATWGRAMPWWQRTHLTGGACSTNGGEEDCIYDIGGKAKRKETHWEDQDVGW